MTPSTVESPRPPELTRLLRRLTGDQKHAVIGNSTLDVLWVLYDRVLRVSPDRPDDPGRDRFLLSKGHGPHAYYAVLAAKGFIPEDWLDDLGGADSRLGHHPDRLLIPGVEIGSGSLGHGLGLGVGTALGLLAQERFDPHSYVLVGDGELQEGANYEAIAYAGATGLDRLTVIVADNGSADPGWPWGVESIFTSQGWAATTVDGHDRRAIESALRERTPARPHVVVAELR